MNLRTPFILVVMLVGAFGSGFSAELKLKVLDRETGKPLPGVEVTSARGDDDSPRITDVNGELRLRVPDGAEYELVLEQRLMTPLLVRGVCPSGTCDLIVKLADTPLVPLVRLLVDPARADGNYVRTCGRFTFHAEGAWLWLSEGDQRDGNTLHAIRVVLAERFWVNASRLRVQSVCLEGDFRVEGEGIAQIGVLHVDRRW